MSDRKEFNAAAAAILAAAERAKAAQKAEEAGSKALRQPNQGYSVLADDTLGRMIQYCMPFFKKWVPRYFKVFSPLSIAFIVLRFRQLYLRSGVEWYQFGRWLDANEPMILPKMIGLAALVAGWFIFMWLAVSVDRERARRKRDLKAARTSVDAGFNSQT